MKLQRAAEVATAIWLSVSLAGCAAMFHGTTQQVYIRSNMDDAKLYVNEAYIGTGNGMAVFHKNKNYTIIARKAGCQDGMAIATKSFDAVTLLGILLDWGIISILIVDGLATGAWQQFDQTSYVLDPNCSGGNSTPVQQSAPAEHQGSDAAEGQKPHQPTTNFNNN